MGVNNFAPTNFLFTNAMMVAENLQAIRNHYNKTDPEFKINVHIGYRTAAKNKSVGGVDTSQHLVAAAVDFSAYGYPLHKIFNDIKNGVIKLPHIISQVIIEESLKNKGQWGWIHLGIWSDEWRNNRKSIGKDGSPNQFLQKFNGVSTTVKQDLQK